MPLPEILNVPPVEAVRRFERRKDLEITFSWQDADAALHARAFTVAKAVDLDILTDIRKAVDRAISDGITLDTFRSELEPLLVKRGWWGREPIYDPLTKKTRIVQVGSPHRLRTIFDANLRASYGAGRWERIQRVKADLPYLRYVAVVDERTREEHLGWHGTVLPVDHPFWQTHYPPNGWGCRCIVQQLGDDDLERYGYQVTDVPSNAGETREWVNKRTGEMRQIPVGLDPGWDHNVGRVGRVGEALEQVIEKMDAAPEDLARSAARSFAGNPGLSVFLGGEEAGSWPLAVAPQRILGAIRGRSRTLRLSSETARSHARFADFDPEDWLRVQRVLDEGRVFRDGPRSTIAFLEEGGRLWATSIKATRGGRETYMTSLHRAESRHLRRSERNLDEIFRE